MRRRRWVGTGARTLPVYRRYLKKQSEELSTLASVLFSPFRRYILAFARRSVEHFAGAAGVFRLPAVFAGVRSTSTRGGGGEPSRDLDGLKS
ncbi:hypothetical protein KSP40_PGU016651 [Platanthera guangdongensis]|uniref:Uncharacterized protein n=1 Tax=Platanthera guangdongensis TaxID=2320717 RepID=A0ABR2MG65_9ASPA